MIFRHVPAKGVYQTVALAFLDILGFKHLLQKRCSESPEFLINLISNADFFTQARFDTLLERRIISDSVIIWTEDLNQGLLAIANIASLLQATLLKQGCLIRGAIVIDKHFSHPFVHLNTTTKTTTNSSDEIIVSPALAKAAELEKRIGTPEIIFDENPALILQLNQAKINFPNFRVHTGTNSKGQTSVQGWFTSHELMGFSKQLSALQIKGTTAGAMSDACKTQALVELNAIRKEVLNNLITEDSGIKTKWQFIADKFNAFLTQCPQTPELPKTIPISQLDRN
ncbi:MAG: hypothetical protein U1E10_01500 [Bdellovibrionales bacterium]|nr:hypothetical protein [Bdellovibrionales bacterium]